MPILFLTALIDLIGFGIVIPILPFLSPQYGASKFDIALIITCYAVCAGLCGPYWGRLSDRIGRKPVIMTCLAGVSLSYLALALASSLWMIFAARAMAGLFAGNFGVANAMVADLSHPENRARNMGIIGSAFGFGMVIGPLLGGLLSGDSGDFALPCMVAGGMSLLALLAAWIWLPESLSSERRAQNSRKRKGKRHSIYAALKASGNRLFVLQFCFHTICVSGTTYLFPLWVGDLLAWGPREVGLVFAALGAIMAFVQALMVGRLARSFGEVRVLRAGAAGLSLGLLVAIAVTGQIGILFVFLISCVFSTVCMPMLNSLSAGRVSADMHGEMLGTTSSSAAWGRVFGPLLAGSLLAVLDYAAAWGALAVVALCYLSWTLGLKLTRKAGALPQ